MLGDIGTSHDRRMESDTFPKLLLRHVKERAEHPAIREKTRGIWHTLSWRSLGDEVMVLAAALRARGLQRGAHVALLGGNGAGKSTTLKSISTLLASERGAVTKGSIEFRGRRIDTLSPGDMVGMGMVQVMEGRHCFAHLSVEDNLITGAYTRPIKGAEVRDALEKVYAYFPRLKTRRASQAAYTSGGEQQMCAIGRALMANPSMVLLDEPSMGLAPQIVEEVFEIVKDLNVKEKVTFLLAEQNTNMALRYSTYGYIMESGRVVMDGPAADLATNEDVKEFYLGVGGGERKSFRDVKSYKRRKRWLA